MSANEDPKPAPLNQSEAHGNSDEQDRLSSEQIASFLERPTKIAKRLERLKDTTVRIAKSRERLPQPLFWSLLHSQLNEIKRSKERSRILRKELFGIGSE